jgi:RNA polymerase sigma factor (sigma-70 family)
MQGGTGVSSPSDHELIRRVGAGDLDALGTLFSRHYRHVYALCLRLTGDSDAAEDLTQESFLRILRFGESFDGRSKFTTWLYRLVRNRCLDHISGRRRDARNVELLAGSVDSATQQPDCDNERRELIHVALSHLSPEKREVLLLSRFENLRYQEIAEVCDISVGNVKARAHRAMKELRRIVHDLESDL